MVLRLETAVADVDYWIGSKPIRVKFPQFSLDPYDADVNFQYSIAIAPDLEFITLLEGGSLPQVEIYTMNIELEGPYLVTVTTTDTFSGISRSETFTVNALANPAKQMIILQTAFDYSFKIGDPPLFFEQPTYQYVPYDAFVII